MIQKIVIFIFLLISHLCYSDEYNRIVSLGPAITEELYLLGAGEKLAGVTTYCINPVEAKQKEKVGTVTEIDVEKILSLRPDLVLATPLTNVRQVEKLKSAGIKVESFSLADNFSDICRQFLELGKIIGKESEANEIVDAAKEKVDKVIESTKAIPKIRVFIQVGARPLYTMTKDSFVNDYIELSGGINIAGDNKTGLYSMEEVLEQNPDVILIVAMEFAGDKEKYNWEQFKQLKAVSENKIYVLDSYKLCSPTPESFAEMLEVIARILHEPK
jgi:iron complex transport system substrate-binding protein